MVFDIGSNMTRVGFSIDEYPKGVFPTTLNRHKDDTDLDFMVNRLIAPEFQTNKLDPSVDMIEKRPVEYAICKDRRHFGMIINYCLSDILDAPPEYTNCLIADTAEMTPSYREQMCEVAFEDVGIKGLAFKNQQLLALFSVGRYTGMVLDVGHTSTHAIGAFEGALVKNSNVVVQMGGREVTSYLLKLLTEQRFHFTTTYEKALVQEMKEKLCYCKITDHELASDRAFEMPDGSLVVFGRERIDVPEILFKPEIIGMNNSDSLQSVFMESLTSITDESLYKETSKELVISGGGSLFDKFDQRILKEIKKTSNLSPAVICPNIRNYCTWLGGSVVAELPNFQSRWVTKQMYMENGLDAFRLDTN